MKVTPLKLGLAALVVCALGLLGTWLVARKLVATSNMPVGQPPPSMELAAATLKAAGNHGDLGYWYRQLPTASATIILLHPAHGNRGAMLGRAQVLIQAGYSVLLADLRGHGTSPAELFTAGYEERHDVLALIDFVKNQHPAQQVAVIGWSFGGAAAVMAQSKQLDAVVLESVYPSIEDAIRSRLDLRLGGLSMVAAPLLNWQLSQRLSIDLDDLRPIDHMADLGCPSLVLAGEDDRRTTLAASKHLFAAAREPKQFVSFPGAGHVDLFAFDRELYSSTVLAFLAQHLSPAE